MSFESLWKHHAEYWRMVAAAGLLWGPTLHPGKYACPPLHISLSGGAVPSFVSVRADYITFNNKEDGGSSAGSMIKRMRGEVLGLYFRGWGVI